MKTQKELEADRRRKYREELDMIIQLKLKHKESNAPLKQSLQSTKNLELCEYLEKEEQNYLRQMQKDSLQQSLVSQQHSRQTELDRVREEQRAFNKQLVEVREHQRSEEEQRREAKHREGRDVRHCYQEHLSRKRQEAEDEGRKDKDFCVAEQAMRAKLEQDNRDFLEKVRAERRRISNVVNCFRQVNDENNKRNHQIDHAIVEKGFLDKEAKDLERQRSELERMQGLKQDVNQTLLQQIENNRIQREVIRYEQMRAEHDKLAREMETQKDLNDKKRLERQRTVRETMAVLEAQIKEREKRLLGDNYLTLNEEEYNCHLRKDQTVVVCPEKTTECIPGFCVQQDRLRMNKAVDKSFQLNDHFIKQALVNPGLYTLERDRSSCRIGQLLNPANTSSMDSLNKTRRQFKNEYDFLKYKNWNKNYNIISNKPVL